MANLLERFTKPRREMGCFQQGNCMIIVTALWAAIYLLSIGGTQKGRRPPPRMGWGRRPYGFAVGIAPSADGALGRWGSSRRARRGCFARCGGREFRWLRPATRGAASGLRDWGNLPPVGTPAVSCPTKNRVKLLSLGLHLEGPTSAQFGHTMIKMVICAALFQ